jgi:hypothetical protein
MEQLQSPRRHPLGRSCDDPRPFHSYPLPVRNLVLAMGCSGRRRPVLRRPAEPWCAAAEKRWSVPLGSAQTGHPMSYHCPRPCRPRTTSDSTCPGSTSTPCSCLAAPHRKASTHKDRSRLLGNSSSKGTACRKSTAGRPRAGLCLRTVGQSMSATWSCGAGISSAHKCVACGYRTFHNRWSARGSGQRP